MSTPKTAVLFATFLLSLLTHAGDDVCPPQPPWTQPSIPDGSHANPEEMLSAQENVLNYVRGIEHWNDCNPYVHGLQSGRMLTRAREVADAYNDELRKFLSLQHNTASLSPTENAGADVAEQ